MHTGHIVVLVVRIMDKDHIRPTRGKVVILISRHRHISRIQIPLVMLLGKAAVRVFVVIRDGDHIGVTVRVRIRGFPDTFQ